MKKLKPFFFILAAVALIAYGSGRLYFYLTGGFRIAHISSNFSPDPRWETRALTTAEQQTIDSVLAQPFTYLGKGCQSYVFLSEDGNYVLKFLKYQRFRPQEYLYWFSFLPPVESLIEEKITKKRKKLDDLFSSWVLAFDHLQKETGLIYVHLNKTSHFAQPLIIKDKLGYVHALNPDRMEFLIQKKATMLCSALDKSDVDGGKQLLDKLFAMILSEYHRGFADNDHALMQNTGVFEGNPVHIDVGQFVQSEAMKNPEIYQQELFNKYYKFRLWLQKKHPELYAYATKQLQNEIGERYSTLKHIPKPH